MDAFAGLKPGDELTVDMDSVTVQVIVASVYPGTSVTCRFPVSLVSIEITADDLASGQRAFRRGWDVAPRPRIRPVAFVDY